MPLSDSTGIAFLDLVPGSTAFEPDLIRIFRVHSRPKRLIVRSHQRSAYRHFRMVIRELEAGVFSGEAAVETIS